MPGYDIRETMKLCGPELAVNTTPGTTRDWVVTEITAERVRMENDGYTVLLEQHGPRDADLPFEATRVTPAGDEYRLTENDRLLPVWHAAEAYMLGSEEK